jgi:hypothetical protein
MPIKDNVLVFQQTLLIYRLFWDKQKKVWNDQ